MPTRKLEYILFRILEDARQDYTGLFEVLSEFTENLQIDSARTLEVAKQSISLLVEIGLLKVYFEKNVSHQISYDPIHNDKWRSIINNSSAWNVDEIRSGHFPKYDVATTPRFERIFNSGRAEQIIARILHYYDWDPNELKFN